MKDLQNLLTQVSIITKKNSEYLDATGGRFNMFGILGVDHYENTHSSIISEFLNPKGSHGLKSQYLKAFLNKFNDDFKVHPHYNSLEKFLTIFKPESSEATTEYHTSFGRIDILVEDNKGHAIILENKIYAGDQWEQLSRYNEFAKGRYKEGNFIILYLTLSGMEASKQSGRDVNYYQISYSTFITEWLEECLNISARFPLVRETINQYINHLKKLTNQDMDTKNKEEIVRILASSEDNLQAAFTIFENIGALKDAVISNYFNPQLHEIASGLDIKVFAELKERKRDGGFKFQVPKWSYFYIQFDFDADDCRGLNYYYDLINVERKPSETTIQKLFSKFEKHNSNQWLPCGYSYVNSRYRNWNSDAYFAIRSGEMKKEIKRIVEIMMEQAKDLEM